MRLQFGVTYTLKCIDPARNTHETRIDCCDQ